VDTVFIFLHFSTGPGACFKELRSNILRTV